MLNYAWHFSQSETAKYFEWIIINNYLNSITMIPSLQTSYKNMLNSVDVKFMHLRWCMFIGRFRRKRVVHFCKYSPNSRCRRSNCFLAVLVMFLANSLKLFHYQNNSTSSPGLFNSLAILLHTWRQFHILQLVFQNWPTIAAQVMINYAWDLNQSEKEKYFEWN